MAEKEEAPAPPDLIQAAIDRIRDVTKWFVGGLAAAATALIAGTQISSLGEVCGPYASSCGRLWGAMGIGALALAGLGLAAWSALRVLIPREFGLSSLIAEWGRGDKSAVYNYFTANPEMLQGLGEPPQIRVLRDQQLQRFRDLVNQWNGATDPRDKSRLAIQVNDAHAYLEDLESRIRQICDIATYEDLSHDFRHRRLMGTFLGGAAAAIGIVLFAWLANPPERLATPISLRSADLTGADLSGASLRGADLTGADLSRAELLGADLRDAKVKDVVWVSTTCPDGTNSNDANSSCVAHLIP